MNSQIISERLKVLGNPTLKYRRYRGDMIEMYKILHGIYDTAVSPDLPTCQDECWNFCPQTLLLPGAKVPIHRTFAPGSECHGTFAPIQSF